MKKVTKIVICVIIWLFSIIDLLLGIPSASVLNMLDGLPRTVYIMLWLFDLFIYSFLTYLMLIWISVEVEN